MRCGAKCFHVQLEIDGNKKTKPVIARTPAEARKLFRKDYGAESIILSVQERKVGSHKQT